MPPHRLIRLFHRRWAVRVLGELERDGGAKFITLANRLDVGRETLRATLDELIEQGLVERNTGHGHPMRPEYLLTGTGRRVAPTSLGLLRAVRRLDIESLAWRKWTMPLTWAMGRRAHRFSELRAALPGITARALTLALKDMQGVELVEREVFDDYPPVSIYRLAPRGRPVLAALTPLARMTGTER